MKFLFVWNCRNDELADLLTTDRKFFKLTYSRFRLSCKRKLTDFSFPSQMISKPTARYRHHPPSKNIRTTANIFLLKFYLLSSLCFTLFWLNLSRFAPTPLISVVTSPFREFSSNFNLNLNFLQSLELFHLTIFTIFLDLWTCLVYFKNSYNLC